MPGKKESSLASAKEEETKRAICFPAIHDQIEEGEEASDEKKREETTSGA